MPQRRLDQKLDGKVRDIVRAADTAHHAFYKKGTFTGPSLHFHRRARGLEGRVTKGLWLELIYAVLTSWGMHRMGDKGAKMVDFAEFTQSIEPLWPDINKLKNIQPGDLSDGEWECLKRVFWGVKVMKSETRLVGNSKVLAHLLPNLVAPIDREYTLRFLFGSTYIQNDLQRQWLLFRKIHEEFYYRVALKQEFWRKADRWVEDTGQHLWDTSVLKVIDNLVIGSVVFASAKRRRLAV